MAGANQIVQTLPPFQWRGLEVVPCSAAPYQFGNRLAAREYPYRDGEGHDNTGRKAYRGSITLHFSNTIDANLYPTIWNDYRPALADGSAGDMVHPDLGPLRARILDGSVSLVAENTAGIVVQFEWAETVEDLDKQSDIIGSGVSPIAAATASDAAMAALGFTYPTGEPDPSLLEAIKSIEGQVLSIGMTIEGKINQVIGTVDSIIDQVKSVNRNDVWPLLDSLNLLRDALESKRTAVNKSTRPVGTKTLTADITLDAFAAVVGNKVDEVMGLNVSALSKPFVSKGTTLSYYLGT